MVSPVYPRDGKYIKSSLCGAKAFTRAPTSADFKDPLTGQKYPIPTIWIDTTGNDAYVLVDIAGTVATWDGFGSPSSAVLATLTGDGGTAVDPDGSGDITITGTTVANATRAKPVYVDDSVANAMDIEVQVAAAVTGAPGDKNDAGLASFNDTQFTVDADGYVAIKGGADLPGIQTLTGDTGGAIGPDASGDIGVVGGTGVTVAGTTNTLTINAASATPLSFPTDSGTATPAANALTIAGGTGINTSGSGATATVNLDSPVLETNGGTGTATYTTGDILYSDASNSLAKLGIGSTGDVLKVIAGVPGWGTDNSGNSTNTNANTFYVFEDFMHSGLSTLNASTDTIKWNLNGTGGVSVNVSTYTVGTNPGIVDTGSIAGGGNSYLRSSNSSSPIGWFYLGSGSLTVEYYYRLPVLSDGTNAYEVWMGLSATTNSSTSGTDPDDGIFFYYAHGTNSGDWVCTTRASSSSTATNSTSTVDTSWHRYTITVNAAATSVTFAVDGTTIATNTTNIPSSAQLGHLIKCTKAAGTVATQSLLDWCATTLTLTSSRY